MTATIQMKVCVGSAAVNEYPLSGAAANWNLSFNNTYDDLSTNYCDGTNRIPIPSSGTQYSFERWIRWVFTGTFTTITNVKAYISAWTPSCSEIDIKGGESATGVTAVRTASTIATTTKTSWDATGEAINITPAAGIDASGEKTDYLVVQLVVPSTAITGDIGTATLTLQYDET